MASARRQQSWAEPTPCPPVRGFGVPPRRSRQPFQPSRSSMASDVRRAWLGEVSWLHERAALVQPSPCPWRGFQAPRFPPPPWFCLVYRVPSWERFPIAPREEGRGPPLPPQNRRKRGYNWGPAPCPPTRGTTPSFLLVPGQPWCPLTMMLTSWGIHSGGGVGGSHPETCELQKMPAAS